MLLDFIFRCILLELTRSCWIFLDLIGFHWILILVGIFGSCWIFLDLACWILSAVIGFVVAIFSTVWSVHAQGDRWP